nr:uncharacterized protein LOC115106135 [Oncorhynchus nerka]
MKCFETLVKDHTTSFLPGTLNPLQFPCRPDRSTDDAITIALHTSLTHLDKRNEHDYVASHSSNSIIKFTNGTTVVTLINNNNETAYREKEDTDGVVPVFNHSLKKFSFPNGQEVFVPAVIVIVSLWWTFGSGTRLDVGSNSAPTLTVLTPSSEELSSTTTATLTCLANKGFPSDWTIRWKVDGTNKNQEISSRVLEKDGLYSWSSTLTLTAEEWTKAGEVTCEAQQKSQTPVTKTLRKADCSG